MSDPNKADFEPAFQLDDQRNQTISYSSDFTYSDPMSSAAQNDSQITGKLTLFLKRLPATASIFDHFH